MKTYTVTVHEETRSVYVVEAESASHAESIALEAHRNDGTPDDFHVDECEVTSKEAP